MSKEVSKEYKATIKELIETENYVMLDILKDDYRGKLSFDECNELEQYEAELLTSQSTGKSSSNELFLTNLFSYQQADGLALKDKDEPIGKWLRYYYIPNFHPSLKMMDIQAPIAACAMLLNASLYMRGERGQSLNPIPNIICLGNPGSGKTTWANQVLKMQAKDNTYHNRDSTLISIIDTISEMNSRRKGGFTQPPPTVLLDNLDIKEQDDFARYRNLLIATTPTESIRSISKRSSEADQSEFNYYSYVLATTIMDIRPRAETSQFYNQIVTRCIFLMFDSFNEGMGYMDINKYDWDSFQSAYTELWNDNNTLEWYRELFDEFPESHHQWFHNRRSYDISKMLIATGVVSGVFSDLIDGLESFSCYWQKLDSIVDVIRDPIVDMLRNYVSNIFPKRFNEAAEKERIRCEKFGWDYEPPTEMVITKNELHSYLFEECGMRLSSTAWRVDVPILMRALGYKHDSSREGYNFVIQLKEN